MARRRASPPDADTLHYEVRCPNCNVSFALGTKRCLHCGSRTAPPGAGPLPSLRQDLADHQLGPSSEFDPATLEEELAAESEEMPRSPFRMGMSAVWILLVLIGSVYRVCTGG